MVLVTDCLINYTTRFLMLKTTMTKSYCLPNTSIDLLLQHLILALLNFLSHHLKSASRIAWIANLLWLRHSSLSKPKVLVDFLNGLLKWEEQNRLVYYKENIYIPNNKEVHGNIVKFYHDSPVAGYFGKHGTLELVSCLYWWPQIALFVDKYILDCEKCQRYKSAKYSKAVLQSQKVPAGH
jgi:hypothetical protein